MYRTHHRYVGNKCLKLQLSGVTARVILDPDPAGDLNEFLEIDYTFFRFIRHFHQITVEILNKMKFKGHHHRYVRNRCLKVHLRGVTVNSREVRYPVAG